MPSIGAAITQYRMRYFRRLCNHVAADLLTSSAAAGRLGGLGHYGTVMTDLARHHNGSCET